MEDGTSNDKLVAMILLVTRDRWVNRTTLNKLCFFSDVVALIQGIETAPASTYKKLDFGPVPVGIDVVRNEMVQKELLNSHIDRNFNYLEYSYQAGKLVNWEHVTAVLGAGMQSIVERTVLKLSSYTASTLSTLSHGFEPWKSAPWYSEMELGAVKLDQGLRDWLQKHELVTA
jgi:hypothetical protein